MEWQRCRCATLLKGGQPARIAAVLFVENQILHTPWEPSQELARTLKHREDNQIMAWELLSIALGVSTFQHHLTARRVRVWSDNVGAENGLRAGAAKSADHNMSESKKNKYIYFSLYIYIDIYIYIYTHRHMYLYKYMLLYLYTYMYLYISISSPLT